MTETGALGATMTARAASVIGTAATIEDSGNLDGGIAVANGGEVGGMGGVGTISSKINGNREMSSETSRKF